LNLANPRNNSSRKNHYSRSESTEKIPENENCNNILRKNTRFPIPLDNIL
jgi:hypothetical protein